MLILNLLLLFGLITLGNKLFDAFCLQHFEATLKLNQPRASKEEEFDLLLMMENQKILLLPIIKIHLELPSELRLVNTEKKWGSQNITFITSLLPYQKSRRRITLTSNTRGVHTIKTELEISDFFGLVQKPVHFDSLKIIIHPSIPSDESLLSTCSGLEGDQLTQRFLHPDPIFFTGTRPYTYQDPLKEINWKASAKGQGLLVKQHDTTSDFNVILCLLVDNNENLFADNPDFLEAAIDFSAFILNEAWLRQAPLGLITNAVQKVNFGSTFRPECGLNHTIRCFDVLSTLAPFKLSSSQRLLQNLVDFTSSGNECYLLASKMNDGIANALLAMVHKGIHPTLLLYEVQEDLFLPKEIQVHYLRQRIKEGQDHE